MCKWRWTPWAPVPNKPTDSVDVQQHLITNNVQTRATAANTRLQFIYLLGSVCLTGLSSAHFLPNGAQPSAFARWGSAHICPIGLSPVFLPDRAQLSSAQPSVCPMGLSPVFLPDGAQLSIFPFGAQPSVCLRGLS